MYICIYIEDIDIYIYVYTGRGSPHKSIHNRRDADPAAPQQDREEEEKMTIVAVGVVSVQTTVRKWIGARN